MTIRIERFISSDPTGVTLDHSNAVGPNLLPPYVTLIAAMTKDNVIGKDNGIPWHLPEDFKHFSSTTRGHVVIMGSKTWESLPEKFRPLPKRLNIVITSRPDELSPGAHEVAPDVSSALSKAHELVAEDDWGNEIFVIGGESIYRQTFDLADRLLLSIVDGDFEGDTFFPDLDSRWRVRERDRRDGFEIIDYRRG